MKKAQITGIGFNVPERIVTNQDLEEIMDTSDQWIQDRSGIIERRWVGEESNTSILAIEAAKQAMLDAEIDAKEIELAAIVQPITGGNEPATPPITMFWGVILFNHIV